jgi:protein-disulfide isomerase
MQRNVPRILSALPVVLLLLAGAGPAKDVPSGEPPAFTPAQRAEIVRILREALKTDPSILREAVTALQAEEGSRHEAAARAAIGSSSKALLHDPGDPVAGNPAGDVTVVEFFDIRCPYCRQMQPVLEDLLRQDRGVRLVLKEFPVLGPESKLGARALLAAERQGGYLKLHAALMRSRPPTEVSLRADAANLGLDWARLQHDMADPAIQQKIEGNLGLARAFGIQGTPAFVVGGTLIEGAVDLAALQHAISEARGK